MSSGLDELARATPATRDRFVDFLRAASIVAVVFGHWFISINHLERAVYSTTSAVGLTSGMWLEHPRPWKATIFLNGVIMTLFLWHMTAYFIVLLTLWPLGVGHQQDTTAAWWLLRPVFIGLSALVLAGIVALVGRFERPVRRSPAT